MREEQAVAIDIEHCEWIVCTIARVISSSFGHHLVHERVAT